MLEGRTADCLAIANTAILMRLINEFIERGLIGRQGQCLVVRRRRHSRKLPECRSQQFRGGHQDHPSGADAQTR